MSKPVLDHPLISARYFFPTRAELPNPFWVEVGPARLACYYQPYPEAKTIVHFHGNGEVVADHLTGLVAALEQLGYNCFLACQFSGVNVPPLFGNNAPPLFGNDAPLLFGNDAPPA
jgi:hypothetical protein